MINRFVAIRKPAGAAVRLEVHSPPKRGCSRVILGPGTGLLVVAHCATSGSKMGEKVLPWLS